MPEWINTYNITRTELLWYVRYVKVPYYKYNCYCVLISKWYEYEYEYEYEYRYEHGYIYDDENIYEYKYKYY